MTPRHGQRRRNARQQRPGQFLCTLAIAGLCLLPGCETPNQPLATPHLDQLPSDRSAPTRPQRDNVRPARFHPPSETQLDMRAYIDEAREEGREQDALQVLRELADRPPMSRLRAEAMLALAVRYRESGSHAEAEAIWTRLRQQAPPMAAVEAHFARAADQTGDTRGAEEAWRNVARLEADRLEAWLALIRILSDSGRTAEARDVMLRYERTVDDLGLRLAQRHPAETKLVWLARLDVDSNDPRIWHSVARAIDDPNPVVALAALELLERRAGPAVLPRLRARQGVELPGGLPEAIEATIAAIEDRHPSTRTRGRRR